MKKILTACLVFTAATAALPAGAAEIAVLASPNMRPLLTDIAPDFERARGHKITVTYDAAGAVQSRVAAGEQTDVILTLRPLLDELAAQAKAKDVGTVGRSFIAVVVPAGAPKPDISSVEAFKRALLAAKSIVYSDPAKGGLSGIFTARMIERLGIADQVKPKTKLVPPGGEALVEVIAKKEADFGIDQLTVVDGKPGVEVVGLLSKEFGVDIVMGTGIAAGAKQPEAAATLVKFLTSPAAAPMIKKRGMEPG
jgi:molybdate transport system substrate-binding protein